MTFRADQNYAGDLSAAEAWDMLRSDPSAQLIDVRTMAEWSFVGIADLSLVGRHVHCVEWQKFPSMTLNTDFLTQAREALAAQAAQIETPVLFMCRSGGRSRAAAIAMTQAGCSRAFNISGGFEGDLDAEHHRGLNTGWKAAGLPWRQS